MPTQPSRHEGDHVFAGTTRFIGDVSFPAGAIVNADIDAAAGFDYTKMEHLHALNYAQPNTTATAVTQVIHRVRGATAVVVSIHAGSIAIAVGAATVTVDLKKNGTTILSGVITLDSGNVAYVGEAGTISSPNLVAGDVLTLVTTATAGGGTIPTGLYVTVNVAEDPA